MTSSQLVTLITILLTFATSLVGLYTNNHKLKTQKEKIDEVHTMVNSQHDDMSVRIDQLTTALSLTGAEVPRSEKTTP